MPYFKEFADDIDDGLDDLRAEAQHEKRMAQGCSCNGTSEEPCLACQRDWEQES